MGTAGEPVRGAVRNAQGDVRGTQSFVAVMGRVWRHPSWVALELAWRWIFAAVALVAVHHYGLAVWRHVASGPMVVGSVDLAAMTVTQPADAAGRLTQAAATLWAPLYVVARWLLPVLGVLWVALSTVGRCAVLKRMDSSLQVRPLTQLLLAAVRLLAFAGVWAAWLGGVSWAAMNTITLQVSHGHEANLVGFCAIVVVGSLVLFVLWSVLSWVLTAAPLLSMEHGRDAAASIVALTRLRGVRAKLIEINLVMGIARVALLVLFMVFSACPLPFESVETREFLVLWTAGVGVVYLLALEYFSVVRTAAYLMMLRAFDGRR